MFGVFAKMYMLNKNSRMKASDIRLYQRRRFEELLTYVFDHSRFYASYYEKCGIRREHIGSLKITDLPTANKKMLMDNFDDVVCDPGLRRDAITKFVRQPENTLKKYLGKYTVICSSGTTGQVGVFVYSPDELQYSTALTATREVPPFGNLPKRTRTIGIVATDGNYAGITLIDSSPKVLFNNCRIPIDMSLDEMCRRVNAFPGVHIIGGYAGGVYQLARLQLAGRIHQHPSQVMCSAEALTPAMRDTIKEAFGVTPSNFYAASESLSMAAECRFHSGMHLFTDCHIFELLDDQAHCVSPGETGRLVITNLYRRVQPIIRYELNDLVSIDESPCECGSPFPRIKAFGGRESVQLEFEKDGSRGFLHPSKLGDFDVPGVQVTQFVQTDSASLLVNSIAPTSDRESVSRAIEEKAVSLLRSSGLGFVGVTVRLVECIPMDPKTRKIPLIVPLKKWA